MMVRWFQYYRDVAYGVRILLTLDMTSPTVPPVQWFLIRITRCNLSDETDDSGNPYQYVCRAVCVFVCDELMSFIF